MPVPLLIAAPAAAAGLAYVNAKGSLAQDSSIIFYVISGKILEAIRERRDRLNLFYLLEQRAQNKKYQDRDFLVFEGKHWTYKEVYEIVLKYGSWLKKAYGVKSKEIVAMNFENSDKFVFMWFGLWSIGAYPAFINYNLTGKALAHCIRASTARLAFIDPNVQKNVGDDVHKELSGIQFVTFTPDLELSAMNSAPIREPDSERSEDSLSNMAILIYTSGTTGLPKPAIVSWTKCNAAAGFVATWMGLKYTDIYYTCMPLYHSSAALLGLLSTLSAGATMAIGRKFSTRTFWPEVRASNATYIQYVGETCRYLLSAKPQFSETGENLDKQNKVRVAFGNGLRPDVWNKFKERFGIASICEFYSATESAGGSWNMSNNDFSRGAIGRSGWISRLLFGGRSCVVEVDWETELPARDPVTGFCKRVKTGEPGELLYKLDPANIKKSFQGYFNNAKASDSKIMRDVLTKGDAWFRTGDMIRIDSEGRIYFNDRIGDTFRWKSENVSTAEVSEVLGSHAVVQEANVYGVELPHHDGRAGCVAIVLSEEPSDRLMADLATHMKQLPRFAVPLFLRVTKGMATTGTNKQQKHSLRMEGVDLEKMGEDKMFWLKDGTYIRFKERDWAELKNGNVKL